MSASITDKDSKSDWDASVLEKSAHRGHVDGADRALELIEETDEEVEMDPAALKALVWKIDRVLMPIMTLAQFFQFLDKTTISYANLFGIQKATGLVGTDFAWLGSLFYLGYLFWQPMAAFLLVRVPIRWHLGGTIMLWGTVLTCHAACHNFACLAVCRFVLGMTESAMIPILSSVTGAFYTRDEQATRVGLWFGGVGPSQIIGGLIAYGIVLLKTSVIQGWQFVFILLGPITVLFGIVIFFTIPNSPATCWFLTPAERVMAIKRIRSNKTGTVATTYKLYQAKEALKDPRFYLLGLAILTASIPNGGITSFGAAIVAGFGYSTRQTTLLGMSTGGSETVAMAAGVLLSRLFKGQRGIPAAICIFFSVIGAIIMITAPTKNGRYAGYVMVFWFPVGQMLMISWLQSMISGHTKRSTFYIMYQIAYATGNVIGSQMYSAATAPSYTPAKIGILTCLSVHTLAFLGMAAINKWYNFKRDKEEAANGPVAEEQNIEFMDKTDFEMKSFRYPL